MSNNNDIKQRIIRHLLSEKEASYRNMIRMQQSDTSLAAKTNEESENMFEDGKVGQSLNRVEARSGVVEALQADIDMLSGLDSVTPTEEIQLGDIVETDQGNFFVAVAADKFEIDGVSYHGISTESPLFKKLIGRKNGDTVSVNGNDFTVKNSF